MSNIKPIIAIVVCIALGIGYYAWRRQQQSFADLQRLQSDGATITFTITSRPLIAIDKSQQILYLISGDNNHGVKKLPFSNIMAIKFIETPIVSVNNDQPRGPDSMIISTEDNKTYHVRDLKISAKKTQQLFRNNDVLANKLSLKQRK